MTTRVESGATGFVRKRVLLLLAVVAVVAGGASYVASSWEAEARRDLEARTVSNVFSNMAVTPTLDEVYDDADGDLIADTPEQAALQVKPSELTFSFIASEEAENSAEVWKAATDAIAEKTGLPVSYLRLEDTKTQLAALRGGKLHITAFSTGAVPGAVNTAGFVPLCTSGQSEENGTAKFGYTMQFIVKADGEIKDLKGLKGKKIAFVRPRSNSGFKAAMLELWEKHNLQPERDYQWFYSYSHNKSIAAVLAGDADAAPVASDKLALLVAKDEVAEDSYRVIYESERFPPFAVGCAYNLTPELRDSISAALLELDWTGSKLAEEMAAGEAKQFVPISYKNDWANIRRVDQTARNVNSTLH